MSCFYLPKRLKQLPSSTKKAWNSFTSSVSPKLGNLRSSSLPKTLTRTATRLFNLHHNNKRSRSIPRRPHSSSAGIARDFYYYREYNYYQHLQPYASGPNSPATVYIDRLFGESSSSMSSSSMSKQEVNKNDVTRDTTMDEASASGGSKTRDDSRGGGVEYISSMPNIRGVDERAEEFISKFRQDMQIQREQSIIEFQEMLARSA
ncbi:uncharacterized protein LOC110689536 [Chenopodium quinoa]|uniref:uncharacterized protein LOC110689536 n=1 Tax=Chenopodium quinoa TaxID=63459 RepID=UPI000B77E13E|nr:uncharacterized protein LOC110689536 [Chenopodium quinoa]